MVYGGAVTWDPAYVERHATRIAHDLAHRSKLTFGELLEAILEPFDIGFEEPLPGDPEVTAAERTRVRTCDAIWSTAGDERAETVDELHG